MQDRRLNVQGLLARLSKSTVIRCGEELEFILSVSSLWTAVGPFDLCETSLTFHELKAYPHFSPSEKSSIHHPVLRGCAKLCGAMPIGHIQRFCA